MNIRWGSWRELERRRHAGHQAAGTGAREATTSGTRRAGEAPRGRRPWARPGAPGRNDSALNMLCEPWYGRVWMPPRPLAVLHATILSDSTMEETPSGLI